MLKLYRSLHGVREYWEAWENGGQVTIHWGKLGEKGESREISVKAGQRGDGVIARESEPIKSDGFRPIAEEDLERIVIQYRIEGHGTVKDLDFRYKVEGLMNEGLGWTGLGHCDGGDIGSGTINIFCFVVDAAIAEQVIVRELAEQELLKDAVIAHTTEESAIVLWPKNFAGQFSII